MKIGIFDSGYGGLTILKEIRRVLPQYDYIYLGDNARAPYGTRSFDVIYRYTLEAVRYLQNQDCHLIILACNTASAKALRTIQQCDINPAIDRVLGVIRPTVEVVAESRHIGVVATQGTVDSGSYVTELHKINPSICVSQQACPMWVPIIENGEHLAPGADYFVSKYLDELLTKDSAIDTLLLGCTHYPLLLPKIRQHLAEKPIRIVSQGQIVALSLQDYLRRHADIEERISRGATCRYLTTESADKFAGSASLFLTEPISAEHIALF